MDIKVFRRILSMDMIVIVITGFFSASVPHFKGLPPYLQVYENISTGTYLFTMEATDTDQNNVMKFEVTDTETNTYVNVIQFSNQSVAKANVTLKTPLDRELHEGGIELKFTIIDIRGNTVEGKVRLYILDVCDEFPHFDKPFYTFDIHENSLNGTNNVPLLVYSEIHATDKDNGPNAVVFYYMKPKTESSYWKEKYNKTFSIDLQSGHIYLLQDLDYEENSFYQFTLYAHDGCNPNETTADLTINVQDVQDKPPFFIGLPCMTNLDEGNYSDHQLLQVSAFDGDRGIPNIVEYSLPKSITCSKDGSDCHFCDRLFDINETTGNITVTGFVDWSMPNVTQIFGICTITVKPKTESEYWMAIYNETFTLDPTNGSLYLLKNLDYENNVVYQFTLHAKDTCNLTAVPVHLTIRVKDVQDKPPFFIGLPYMKIIPEGNYNHAFVLRVTAIDGDLGIPNPISYIVIQSDRFCQEHFVLNATTGEIVINGRLAWESDEMKRVNGVCNFIVQAKEIDKHPENQRGQTVANVTVTVIILQLNTQVPQINRTTTNKVQTVRTTMFPSSSSTASTSMVPTSRLPPSYVPDPGEYELHLEFDLKVEMAYNETYKDKTSPQFQNLAKIFSISLTEVFKNIQGFKSIDILRFRPGSVHVDYLINVFGTVDVATVTEEIRSNINFTSIAGVPVNTAYTIDSMKGRLDSMKTKEKCSLASTYLCPFGYYCKPAIASTSVILCIDRCNSSVCQNNGECYIGHHSHDVQCRCGFSETVVYSGQRCEIKTEVVTVQERNLYLIIACAIVVGILLVFISTVCVISRKRKRLKKRLTISHVLQLDEMHKRSNNGVPAMDECYLISLNPALGRYPEGYCGLRVNVSNQDQGLDGGYLQLRDCARRNSNEDYDYIGPEFEVGSRSQHN